ncbi:hypothetical protein QTP88_017410 [Uroleucon formosanum]
MSASYICNLAARMYSDQTSSLPIDSANKAMDCTDIRPDRTKISPVGSPGQYPSPDSGGMKRG